MEEIYELSESEDDFSFSLLSDNESENTFDRSDMECSSDESDIIGHKKCRVTVLPSSSSSSSESESSDDWVDISEVEDSPNIIKFDIGSHNHGPRVSSKITKPIQFFQLFFTEELALEIINETNTYARNKLQGKVLTKNSIWHSWRDVQKDEFWTFIGVILNMGTMPLANMQEYWSINPNSKIPFYPNTFTRSRFNQIFWMLHLKTQDPGTSSLKTRIQKASNFL